MRNFSLKKFSRGHDRYCSGFVQIKFCIFSCVCLSHKPKPFYAFLSCSKEGRKLTSFDCSLIFKQNNSDENLLANKSLLIFHNYFYRRRNLKNKLPSSAFHSTENCKLNFLYEVKTVVIN